MDFLEVGVDAGRQAVERKHEDDDADDAVNEPHGADIKVGTHLIHKECDDGPPQQSTNDNEGIAHDDVIPLVLGQGEAKAREQRDNQEHDQRIAQGEQEACGHVSPVVLALVDVLGNLAHGIVDNHVDGINDQDDAAHDLQDIDIVGDKVGHKRDAQSHKQAIEQITCSCTDTSEETRVAALVQRPLDTQDAHRSNGCREKYPNRHTSNNYGYYRTHSIEGSSVKTYKITKKMKKLGSFSQFFTEFSS